MKRQMILVPLDGSENALSALPYATAVARACGTGIELLAVANGAPDLQNDRLRSLVVQGLTVHLQHIAEHLHVNGIAAETCVRFGDPAETILMQAEKRRARAVVLATHGRGGIDRWLLGSVADTVVRQAVCPVLTVAPQRARAGSTRWWPRRLLVPVDGSPQSEQALPAAYELAAAFGAEVVLARVYPWTTTVTEGYAVMLADAAALDHEAMQTAALALRALRDTAPPGVSVRDVMLRGDAAERLIGLAEADAIDLIVMTSHGRHGVSRLLLGSVADRLIRSGRPTLVIHPVPADALGVPESITTATNRPG